MASNPVFPLYYNDILGSTKTWTDEEFGAYVRLLIDQWDKGFIPKEVFRLNKIADSAEKNWAILSPKFAEVEAGKLQNVTLEKIREKRKNFSDMQREKGEKGGRPKAGEKPKPKPKQSRIKSQTKPEENPKDIEIEIEIEIEKEKGRENIVYPFRTDQFFRWWVLWKRYKKHEHGFHYKSTIGEQAALKKVSTLSDGNESIANQILEEAISNGWKGFFKLKNDAGNKAHTGKPDRLTNSITELEKFHREV